MYNVVRIAIKGTLNITRINNALESELPSNYAIYFDKHTRGFTFLVNDTSMNEFGSDIQRLTSAAGGRVIGKTKCSDDTFLLVISAGSSDLKQLDDNRANNLWK